MSNVSRYRDSALAVAEDALALLDEIQEIALTSRDPTAKTLLLRTLASGSKVLRDHQRRWFGEGDGPGEKPKPSPVNLREASEIFNMPRTRISDWLSKGQLTKLGEIKIGKRIVPLLDRHELAYRLELRDRKKYMTLAEAAAEWGATRGQVQYLVRSRQIPFVRDLNHGSYRFLVPRTLQRPVAFGPNKPVKRRLRALDVIRLDRSSES